MTLFLVFLISLVGYGRSRISRVIWEKMDVFIVRDGILSVADYNSTTCIITLVHRIYVSGFSRSFYNPVPDFSQ